MLLVAAVVPRALMAIMNPLLGMAIGGHSADGDPCPHGKVMAKVSWTCQDRRDSPRCDRVLLTFLSQLSRVLHKSSSH